MYVLTSTRLISSWGKTIVQAQLSQLCPPEVRSGSSVLTSPAKPAPPGYRDGWKWLLWPAATVDPPQLIGLNDAEAVAGLIAAAQLASRTVRHDSPR